MTRRDALKTFVGSAVGATAIAGSVSGCNRAASLVRGAERRPMEVPGVEADSVVARLNRFGFGPTPGQVADIEAQGLDAWFETQLEPSDDEPTSLNLMLERLETMHLGAWDLRSWPEDEIVHQMQEAAVLRAVYSPWQLRERMVDFWTNHFNIYARKGLGAFRKPLDEREVVREHCFGRFPDMVAASSKSTAMLLYLDQQNSSASSPNENYARELLELHTLGVDGGYTQKDVKEVARCFTGWTEERGFLKRKGEFLFRADLHDDGEKSVLGHTIPAGGGVGDGQLVVKIVANHPATARHICGKLCDYFLGHQPAEVVDEMVSSYGETEGEIKPLLRILWKHWPNHAAAVVKRPFDFVASSLRCLQADTDGNAPVEAMRAMGQPLYLWPMPDGYPVDSVSWSASLLGRWNFASALASGSLKGTSIDLEQLTERLAEDVAFQAVFHTRAENGEDGLSAAVSTDDQAKQVALLLSSPEFQWR